MVEVVKLTTHPERVEERVKTRLLKIAAKLRRHIEKGDITALAIVASGPEGSWSVTPPDRDLMFLLGTLEALKARMIERIMEDSEYFDSLEEDDGSDREG